MGVTAEAARSILDRTLDGTFVSLHSSDPGQDGANELRGARYKRQAARWSPATADRTKALAEQLVFLGIPLVDISHACAWDSESGGEPVWSFRLGSAITPPGGNVQYLAFIDAGSLVATLREVGG